MQLETILQAILLSRRKRQRYQQLPATCKHGVEH
jgi:hypothetical protein